MFNWRPSTTSIIILKTSLTILVASVLNAVWIFLSSRTAMLKVCKTLAVVKRDSKNEHPRNTQSPYTNVARLNNDYSTQVSEVIKRRLTQNSQVWVQSGTFPETSSNYERRNQEYNEDSLGVPPSSNDFLGNPVLSFCEFKPSRNITNANPTGYR